MILLDTHALVWFVDQPAKLSRPAFREIEKHAAKRELLVSEISWWEIAMLVQKGRLELNQPVQRWLQVVVEMDGVNAAGITPGIAVIGVGLPALLTDPADRIIYATAQEWGCSLVSADERMQEIGAVKIIW